MDNTLFSAQELDKVREDMRRDREQLAMEEMQAHIRSGIKRKLVDLERGPLFGRDKQEGLF